MSNRSSSKQHGMHRVNSRRSSKSQISRNKKAKARERQMLRYQETQKKILKIAQ